MGNSISKQQVVLTILFIFSLTFFIFVYISYQDKKDDIEFIQKSIQTHINYLYKEVSGTMLKKQLEARSDFIIKRHNRYEKLKAFKAKDKKNLKNFSQCTIKL